MASSIAEVVRVDFGSCILMLEDGTLLRATVRGRLMGLRKSLGNALVVGDLAHFEVGHVGESRTGRRRAHAEDATETVVVTDVEPRRNTFSRRASGRRPTEQVVAANLDQVVVVASVANPAFSYGLTDRVLCQSEIAGLPARVVLNKVDLIAAGSTGRAEAGSILGVYASAGYPGHALSAQTGEGVADLVEACRGSRSLFIGHSGVGKSTLLNALVPRLELLMGCVNEKTGKGRHTTTAALMVRPEPDFELIDTPGVRAFGLWGIGLDNLDHTYREFRPFLDSCKFGDCSHTREPGCAVRAASDQEVVPAIRYASYLKLREEIEQDSNGELQRPRGLT